MSEIVRRLLVSLVFATLSGVALAQPSPPPSGGGNALTYASGISAAGSTQGTATALTANVNVVTSVAANTGVILAGTSTNPQTVFDQGGNTLNVYPPSGSQICSASGCATTNTASQIAAGSMATFYAVTSTQIYVQYSSFQ